MKLEIDVQEIRIYVTSFRYIKSAQWYDTFCFMAANIKEQILNKTVDKIGLNNKPSFPPQILQPLTT